MKYRDMSELCTCYTTLDDFQAELNHDADVAYQEGIVATTKYYKDFETGFIIKISYGYDEDAMWWKICLLVKKKNLEIISKKKYPNYPDDEIEEDFLELRAGYIDSCWIKLGEE